MVLIEPIYNLREGVEEVGAPLAQTVVDSDILRPLRVHTVYSKASFLQTLMFIITFLTVATLLIL